jgi:hypothetical protein
MINATFIPTNIILGACNIPVLNCLKEEEADDMMHKIMRQCNICDCQLIN